MTRSAQDGIPLALKIGHDWELNRSAYPGPRLASDMVTPSRPLRLQDERFEREFCKALVEADQGSVVYCRISRQISVAPEIRRGPIDLRVGL